MKFFFTVRLPSRGGGSTQILTGEHSAASIDELHEILNDNDFILVDEEFEGRDGVMKSRTVLATRSIGKVRPFRPHRPRYQDDQE